MPTVTALALGRTGASPAGLPNGRQPHTPERPGQLGFLTGPWGFSRMGPRAGQGLEMEPEAEASSCPSGVWEAPVPPGPGTPWADQLLPGSLLERGFEVHSGKHRPAAGQGGHRRRGLAGFPWAPGPGREPGLCTLPARGARGWLALGSMIRPAASGSLWRTFLHLKFWVTGDSRAGIGDEGGLGHGHAVVSAPEFLAGGTPRGWEQRLQ